jgi:hypothetical protein
MSEIKNKSYYCDSLLRISIKNCNENKKLTEIANQFFILEDTYSNTINTIAKRDEVCLKSLEMLNLSCKHYIETIK